MSVERETTAHTQHIHGGWVGVAINGHIYGNLFVELLPRQVPRMPSREEIAAALRLLQHMPTPPMPQPNIPHPFLFSGRFPIRHNPLFVGRDAMMQELAQRLKPVGAKAAISTGIGGVGKTTVAAEFAQYYGAYFAGGVFWISCADPSTVDMQVANYGGPGALEVWHPDENLSLAERVARVKRQWESDLPRLIIFDNCDDWADASGEYSAETLLQDWLPQHGGCRVLVTSRRQDWSPALGVVDIFLDVLARPASITLLQSLAKHLSYADADRVAEAMGDLPLALYLAGGYLNRYRHITNVEQFLAELIQIDPTTHRALRGDGTSYHPTRRYLQGKRTQAEIQAELNVARVFALSFDHLQARDPADAAAIALLARASYLAPSTLFPRTLLLASVQTEKSNDRFTVVDGLERLVALGMLERQGDEDLRIHRLLSSFATQAAYDPTAQEQVEQAILGQIGPVDRPQRRSVTRMYLPHIRHRYNSYSSMNTFHSAMLAFILSTMLEDSHQNSEAEQLLKQILDFVQNLPIQNPQVDTMHAVALNNQGELYARQGKYHKALDLFQRSLALREQVFGKNHEQVAQNLSNIASVLDIIGKYKDAEQYYKRALSLKEQIFGLEHFDLAVTLNNLGILYTYYLVKYEEAETVLLRALKITERECGHIHETTAKYLNNLATLYMKQQRIDDGIRLFEQVYEIHKQIFGEKYLNTATSAMNLAAGYIKIARYDEAEALLTYALQTFEQLLDPEHPDIAPCLTNFGHLYRAQGLHTQVEPFLQRSLAIRKKVYGLKHYDTAKGLANLATCYVSLGRQSEAEPLYQQALKIMEATVGKNHPDYQRVSEMLNKVQGGNPPSILVKIAAFFGWR